MRRAKKRWAWKPVHKRPCFPGLNTPSPGETITRRHFWHGRRYLEKHLVSAALAYPEADIVFPDVHLHSVAWDRW